MSRFLIVVLLFSFLACKREPATISGSISYDYQMLVIDTSTAANEWVWQGIGSTMGVNFSEYCIREGIPSSRLILAKPTSASVNEFEDERYESDLSILDSLQIYQIDPNGSDILIASFASQSWYDEQMEDVNLLHLLLAEHQDFRVRFKINSKVSEEHLFRCGITYYLLTN